MRINGQGARELGGIARTLALEAGRVVHERRRAGVSVAATKSSAVDVVTEADQAAEHLIRSRLAELRPDDGFFGEESGAAEGSSGLTWVVDPIDGTVNYLYDIPNYAVSIGVVEGGVDPHRWSPLAGCVYSPGAELVYTAVAGQGAFCGARRLEYRPARELSQAMLGTGFAYLPQRRRWQLALLARAIEGIRDIRRFGSAALDLCAVAETQVDLYCDGFLNPWDFAAGALIATEAGAEIRLHTPAGGLGELVLAGSPELLDAYLALIDDTASGH